MHRSCLLALLLSAPLVHADSLSEADREALIEKLDSVREEAEKSALSRRGPAVAAFRSAMASDGAALELYLKCIEKVDFEDRKRSSQDFREWKRRQGDRLESEGLGRCLRHRLRWLVLMIDASNQPEKLAELAPRVVETLEGIYGSPEQYRLYRSGADHVRAIEESLRGRRIQGDPAVTESAYAKAYGYGGLEVENVPPSPQDLGEAFEKLVFPPLRKKKSFESLREQWQKRIRYESTVHQYNGPERKKNSEPSPDYAKFVSETLPDLKWQMEVDLYKSGDQKRAAVNMLEHIEQYLAHAKAREWADQFRGLINPPQEEGIKPAATAGPVE